MLMELKSKEPGLVAAVRNDREFKKETETSLIAFLDAFAKSFT